MQARWSQRCELARRARACRYLACTDQDIDPAGGTGAARDILDTLADLV